MRPKLSVTTPSDGWLLYGGFNRAELNQSLEDKRKVMNWMVKNNVFDVDSSGFVVANYYKDRDKVMKIVDADVAYSRDVVEKGLA